MSTINCSLDCSYQRDGYCELNSVENISVCNGRNECLYYKKNQKHNKNSDNEPDKIFY
ncbi:hypothetical protein SDC9_121950 [bioreactor metagenome]|uniref:DUF1540 domain-containing protein n=1 Tax=bioreactor metagenome TaxID=1076179 RepID=A0A645CDH1_9ZZZZ